MSEEEQWVDNTHSWPWAPLKEFDNLELLWEDVLNQVENKNPHFNPTHYLFTPLQCALTIRLDPNKTISVLFIICRQQCRGYGTRMLDSLTKLALSRGYSVVVHGPYAPGADKICQKLGMVKEGHYQQYTIHP